MDTSTFMDKTVIPTTKDLSGSLAKTFDLWQSIIGYVQLKYPAAVDEWNYSGTKYGWNFRIKDKKRAIVYLLPRDKFFKIALIFGQKATDAIMDSQVNSSIKSELASAKVYVEGRGIKLDILNETLLDDLKTLIEIKISH